MSCLPFTQSHGSESCLGYYLLILYRPTRQAIARMHVASVLLLVFSTSVYLHGICVSVFHMWPPVLLGYAG